MRLESNAMMRRLYLSRRLEITVKALQSTLVSEFWPFGCCGVFDGRWLSRKEKYVHSKF